MALCKREDYFFIENKSKSYYKFPSFSLLNFVYVKSVLVKSLRWSFSSTLKVELNRSVISMKIKRSDGDDELISNRIPNMLNIEILSHLFRDISTKITNTFFTLNHRLNSLKIVIFHTDHAIYVQRINIESKLNRNSREI